MVFESSVRDSDLPILFIYYKYLFLRTGGARSPGSGYFFFLYHDTNEHCGTGRCTNGVTTRAPELDSDSEVLPVTILMDIKVQRQRGI